MVTAVATNAPAIAVDAARSQIGVPYKFGWATPGKGFDCSGLTMWSYAQAGIVLPHFTGFQILKGTAVSRDQLQPGDLVFPDSGHVQIYSGNGMIIEAPHTGANVREVPMWGFWKARRLAPGGDSVATNTPTDTQGFGVTLPNLNPASAVMSWANNLINEFLAGARHWTIRVFEVFLGGALIIVGLDHLSGGQAGKAIGTAAKFAK